MKKISKEIFIQKLLNPKYFFLVDCSKEFVSLKNTEFYSSKKEYSPENTIFFSFDQELTITQGYSFHSQEKDFFKKNFSA